MSNKQQNPEDVTTVVFRTWKDGSGVIALFPYEQHSGYLCSSYMHVGQHSGADYQGVIGQTLPATEAEYAPLYRELTTLSPEPYKLSVVKRVNGQKQHAIFFPVQR